MERGFDFIFDLKVVFDLNVCVCVLFLFYFGFMGRAISS